MKAAPDATASVKDAEDKITKAVAPVGAGGVLLRDLDIGKLGSIKASIDDATRAASEAKAMAAKAVEGQSRMSELDQGRACGCANHNSQARIASLARQAIGQETAEDQEEERRKERKVVVTRQRVTAKVLPRMRSMVTAEIVGSTVTRMKRAGRQVQRNPLEWSRCRRQERQERQERQAS